MPDRIRLPTPNEMVEHLNLSICGQNNAKKDISVAVYNHYLSQAWRDREGVDLGRYHILMLGPTGVGKTHIVRTLAEYLQVPVGFASATGLVETGYKGNSVETIPRTLLERAGGDTVKAEKGIVFIDEIDKIKCGAVGGRDISGEGVQNALLTLLDGRAAEGFEQNSHATIDTGRLLFICTGAFIGLQEIVESRLGKSKRQLGFATPTRDPVAGIPDQPVYRALCAAETRDLVEFGMIPEFIGRFATVTALHELSRDNLRAILDGRTRDSALGRQQTLARLHGIELVFAPEALDAIADEAMDLGTGARGLHRLLCRAVDGVDYQWPELAAEGVSKVIVTRACVEEQKMPEIIKGPPATERCDDALRQAALASAPQSPRAIGDGAAATAVLVAVRPALTNTQGWTHERLRQALEELKNDQLRWSEVSEEARIWWQKFEIDHRDRPEFTFRIAEELCDRDATISDFFLACTESNTDHIVANLHYLDYMMLKNLHGKKV